MITIAIHGRSGRMGQALTRLIDEDSNLAIAEGLEGDVILDFSHPDALEGLLKRAVEMHTPLVIGTTGISDKSFIQHAASHIPLLYAANFSLGILALKEAALAVEKILGKEASLHILEEHHLEKKDAPSGTALNIKEALARDASIFSLRTPGTIGNHTLIFSTDEEEITLTHRAKSRLLFARGALIAAKKLLAKPIGYYELHDII